MHFVILKMQTCYAGLVKEIFASSKEIFRNSHLIDILSYI